jgi:uncharacterized protein DUF4124
VLLATATIADATLYRWVDDRGHVTYSNFPPPPGTRVVEIVTMEEDRAPTASELRTRQILEEAERERRSLEPGDPAALALGAYSTDSVQTAPDGSLFSGAGDGSGARKRPSAAPRDPCLLSADPRCYELNARSYDPYEGYVATRTDATSSAVGSTVDAGAPRELASTVEAPPPRSPRPALVVPRLTGLPPGTPVKPLTHASSRPRD